MDGETKQPNGPKYVAYVVGFLAVVGAVYSTGVLMGDLRDDVDKLTEWRDAWAPRVLALDEHQNGRHAASELEIERLRKHLGLP